MENGKELIGLDPEVIDSFTQAISVVAKDCADAMRNIMDCFSNVELGPILKQFADLPDPPDKSTGFTYIHGSDTWLPKSLVDMRIQKQRNVARQPKTNIVWTRR